MLRAGCTLKGVFGCQISVTAFTDSANRHLVQIQFWFANKTTTELSETEKQGGKRINKTDDILTCDTIIYSVNVRVRSRSVSCFKLKLSID